MNKKAILSAKDISVQFKVRDRVLTAIRGVSLDLYDGETLAIVGESGSGKSVLTKTFTGMLDSNGSITSGSIMYEDKDLVSLVSDKDWEGIRGSKIATVFQDPMTSLNPILTIGSQISEVIVKHQGKSKEEAKALALELMQRTGIPEPERRFHEYPFQYSGGMRQRIVIAIALACKPDVLICDEPTTALDVTIQAQIIELIKDLQDEYKFTTIYITHDLGVVASVADRVAVMYAGQIVEVGNVEEIFYNPQHPYSWSLLSSLPQLGVKGESLFSIPGTPPSLYSEIEGDAFAPRNPYAMEVDFVEEPPFFEVSPTHKAKTWLLDPRAPKVEKPEIIQNLHEKILDMVKDGGTYGKHGGLLND
jgi:oligopeptide transport system ATP-binding protein